MSRPNWDEYFMCMAKHVSYRSPDPDTKHGCVIVDSENRIVSTGYNGPVRGLPDSTFPWTRPEKYKWVIHAEDNAVLWARRDLKGCAAYVTGMPCTACMRRFIQAGITKVIYGNQQSTMVDKEEENTSKQMALLCNVELGNHK